LLRLVYRKRLGGVSLIALPRFFDSPAERLQLVIDLIQGALGPRDLPGSGGRGAGLHPPPCGWQHFQLSVRNRPFWRHSSVRHWPFQCIHCVNVFIALIETGA
jgi:hypothetical protein